MQKQKHVPPATDTAFWSAQRAFCAAAILDSVVDSVGILLPKDAPEKEGITEVQATHNIDPIEGILYDRSLRPIFFELRRELVAQLFPNHDEEVILLSDYAFSNKEILAELQERVGEIDRKSTEESRKMLKLKHPKMSAKELSLHSYAHAVFPVSEAYGHIWLDENMRRLLPLMNTLTDVHDRLESMVRGARMHSQGLAALALVESGKKPAADGVEEDPIEQRVVEHIARRLKLTDHRVGWTEEETRASRAFASGAFLELVADTFSTRDNETVGKLFSPYEWVSLVVILYYTLGYCVSFRLKGLTHQRLNAIVTEIKKLEGLIDLSRRIIDMAISMDVLFSYYFPLYYHEKDPRQPENALIPWDDIVAEVTRDVFNGKVYNSMKDLYGWHQKSRQVEMALSEDLAAYLVQHDQLTKAAAQKAAAAPATQPTSASESAATPEPTSGP